jgi:DNA-binding transcriptional LysR family regulator
MARAASELAISQPAVSKSIADMEHVLGVKLLDRSPQGVQATRYGRALIKRGTAIFDELRQGVQEIEALADPTFGELRIGASEPIAASIVSVVIERLSREHPRLIFHVLPGYTETLYQRLHQRDVDLVITRTFEPIADEHLNVQVLYEDTLVVVAGSKSKWHRQRGLSLANLVNEPWVLPPLDTPNGALHVDAFRAAGVGVPTATVFTFSLPLREALLGSGRFLATAPSFLMRSPLRHPWLRELPVELPSASSPIAIVTLKNRTLNPVAELFINHVRKVARDLQKTGPKPPLRRGAPAAR